MLITRSKVELKLLPRISTILLFNVAEERVKVLKAINDPTTWAKIKPAIPKAGMLIGGYAQVPEMPITNSLAPESVNALME